LAKYGWSLFRDVLEWLDTPNSLKELHCKLVEGNERENANFAYIFGCLVWSLWLSRNDLIFNNIVAPSPDVCIFRTISFMQRWRILSREQAERIEAIWPRGGWIGLHTKFKLFLRKHCQTPEPLRLFSEPPNETTSENKLRTSGGC
jgi:hypothetical protein